MEALGVSTHSGFFSVDIHWVLMSRTGGRSGDQRVSFSGACRLQVKPEMSLRPFLLGNKGLKSPVGGLISLSPPDQNEEPLGLGGGDKLHPR